MERLLACFEVWIKVCWNILYTKEGSKQISKWEDMGFTCILRTDEELFWEDMDHLPIQLRFLDKNLRCMNLFFPKEEHFDRVLKEFECSGGIYGSDN